MSYVQHYTRMSIGSDCMKKFLNSRVGTVGCLIILVPILLIALALYLLFVPFDILRYHRMPYYKDFKKKYEFFITSSDVVKFYNRIVREQLPIEYVKSNDYEYFIKDGQVLLCDWGNEDIEQVDGEWFFVLVGENNTKMAMKETLENEVDLLKPEHRDLPAKFLIFYNDVTDAEKFERAKECPYFHCVFSGDEDL